MLEQLDSRPIIITGDLNSLYGRDDVKTQFIDAINETGLATAADVWVELQNNGNYPTDKASGEEAGETLDKILYINPATGIQIKPKGFTLDQTGYMYDGKPLGDHFPLAATFEVVSKTSYISNVQHPTVDTHSYYDLQGRQISSSQLKGGIYIERQGEKVIKRINK